MRKLRTWKAIVDKPLNVTASAVAFCAELFQEVQQRGVPGRNTKNKKNIKIGTIKEKAMAAEAICPKVLTGSLGAKAKAPEFAKKAAEVAQLDGEKHEFGRLDNVPWRKSLHRVCHDECHALVQGIREKASEMQEDFLGLIRNGDSQKSQSVEEICADNVVRRVESEIMTCCARSCGWNNRSCMYWPLMSSKEKADWESECCTEMNILNGSTRERLCDATLSKGDKEISKAIIDNRSNTAKDREMLGQDGDVSVGSSRGGSWWPRWPRWLSWHAGSFMETSSMKSFNGQCPPPLNLDKLHTNWTTEWKVMALQDLLKVKVTKNVTRCLLGKKRQKTINGCRIFKLLGPPETSETSNEEQRTFDYHCLDACGLEQPPQKTVHGINETSRSSAAGMIYIHKEVYETKWNFSTSTS